MEQEPPRNKLRIQISSTVRDLLARNLELAEGAQQAFEDDNFDPALVSAALQLNEGVSRTAREFLESGKEYVIFPRDHGSTDQQDGLTPEPAGVLSSVNATEGENNDPKTFGELLTLRLDKALPDEPEFTRNELGSFAARIRGAKNILKFHQRSKFSREETSKILQQVLTTPGENLKRTEEFNRRALLASFPSLRPPVLDKWSSEIGHDWAMTPNVDFQTATQVRGLLMLEKLNLPSKTPT